MAAEIETTAATARARIVGIEIPFWDLVRLLVKIALAAIPALIILAVGGAIVAGMLASIMHK